MRNFPSVLRIHIIFCRYTMLFQLKYIRSPCVARSYKKMIKFADAHIK
jgi:hypothetical protein